MSWSAPLSVACASVWVSALDLLLAIDPELLSQELGVPRKTIQWRLGLYAGAGQREARHWSPTDLVRLGRLEIEFRGTRRLLDALSRAIAGEERQSSARVEGETCQLLGSLGSAVQAISQALADGHVDQSEAEHLAEVLGELLRQGQELIGALQARGGGR